MEPMSDKPLGDDRVVALERRRADFLEAMDALRVTARSRLSLAERIRQQPLPWIATGFLLGLWLGRRAGP